MNRHTSISRAIRIVGLAALVGLSTAVPPASAEVSGNCIDAEEAAFLQLINQYRSSNGLGELSISGTLTDAAEYHSVEMATYGYFSHTAPDGTTVEQNLRNWGYPDPTFGENIVASVETAAAAFDTWKNSAPHNENMLRGEFGAIGIARHYDADSPYGWYWTTDFGGSLDTPATYCDGVRASREGKRGVINDPDVNVRRGPSKSEAVAQTVGEGTAFTVVGEPENGYVPVDANGETLWVADEWIDIEGEGGSVPPPSAGAFVTETVNLRNLPAQEADVIDMIPRDTAIEVTGRASNGFVEVLYNGQNGWVNGQYIAGEMQAMMAVPTTQSGVLVAHAISNIQLMADPTADGSVIMSIPSGGELIATGNASNGYLEVTYQGTLGWADAAYVQ